MSQKPRTSPAARSERRSDSTSDIGFGTRLATGMVFAGALAGLPACSEAITTPSTPPQSGVEMTTVQVPVKEGKFLEAGLDVGVRPAVLKPKSLHGVVDYDVLGTAAYGISYKEGKGYWGPSLGLGVSGIGAKNEAGESVGKAAFCVSPGIFNLNTFGRWALVERLKLPIAQTWPGVKLDVGASYVVSPTYKNLAVEAGVSVALMPTALEINGERISTLQVGPYFQVIADVVSHSQGEHNGQPVTRTITFP